MGVESKPFPLHSSDLKSGPYEARDLHRSKVIKLTCLNF